MIKRHKTKNGNPTKCPRFFSVVMVVAMVSSGWLVICPNVFCRKASATPTYVYGIDVSHWQGTINWASVYSAGYKFAFCKATEGVGYTDPTFTTNMNGGENAGLLMGAYHFATPYTDGVNDAVDEAQYFVSAAGDYIKDGWLRPVLDLEDGASLGKTTLSNWVHEWMDTVKSETGVEPIIYTGSNYANNYLDTSVNVYTLWIAHWTTADSPNTGIWSSWDFWQYSDNGSVSGISGDVDMDRFNGDMSKLNTFVISFPETFSLYDRTGATGYADSYCNNSNPDYHDYSGEGGDCANFVSQCLIAGGINLWKGSDGNGSGVGMDINRQGTLINCDYLSANLEYQQPTSCSYIEDTGVPPDNLTAGDVIIYGLGSGAGTIDDSLSGSNTGYSTGGVDIWRAVDFYPDERPVLTRVEIELGVAGDGISTAGTLQIRESNESGTPKPVDGASNYVVSKPFSKPSGNSWITVDFNDVFDDIALNTSRRYWVCVNTQTSVVWVSTGVAGNRATSTDNAATWSGYTTLTEYNFKVYTANTVDHFKHAVIVVEGNGSSCKIDAHSSSQYHTSWDYLFPATYNRVNFYHFIDLTVTNYTRIRVNTTNLNVTIGPGTHYPYDKPIGQIHLDEEYVAYEYVINETGQKWWHIWYDYRNGWCPANYVEEVVNNGSLFRVRVQTALNVRTGPGVGYSIINITFNGQMFAVRNSAQNGSTTWYNFCYRGRNDAWCSGKYLYFISGEFIFHFDRGWNLISFPLYSPYHNAESLRSNITNCTAVSMWNITTQTFMAYTTGGGSNFNISSTDVFFVYINTTNISFKIVGTPIPPTTTATYSEGWNTIIWLNTTSTDAESFAQGITNCTAVAYWDTALSRFITHPVGTNISNFTINYGQGYFAFIKKP